MIHELRNGAVLYAKDLDTVAAFYSGVVGLEVRRTHNDHIVLESQVFQLVVLRIPKHIANSITIQNPPVRRENTPIKLVFFVESLANARVAAGPLGGALNAEEQEWRFEGYKVCDGCDPEGNVFQLREAAR
jgi:predicted enzyme related to lactoylglutathione lyase